MTDSLLDDGFGLELQRIARKKVAQEWGDMIEYLYQECLEAAKQGKYSFDTDKNIHPSVLRYMKDAYGLYSGKHVIPDMPGMGLARSREIITTTIYW